MDGGPNTYAYVGGAPLHYGDPLGLAWEAADGSVPGWANRIIVGQRVHALFTNYILTAPNLGEARGYGANNSGPTGEFSGLRPDAYNTVDRLVWELKPLSNRDDPDLRRRAEGQVAAYLAAANRPIDPNDETTINCGGWTAGDTTALFTQGQLLGYVQLGFGPFRRVYEITLWQDTLGTDTGLVFYRADLIENPTGELIQDILEALARGPGWVLLPPGRFPQPTLP